MSGASPTIRIASWNIRAAIGPGEPFPPAWWRHVDGDRLARIAAVIAALGADAVALQEVAVLTPNGELLDQPAELARLTGMDLRYAAVHAFALVEPENGRAIGAATWGNAWLTRRLLRDGFALGLPVGADEADVEPAGSGRPLASVTFATAPYGNREPRCAVGGRLVGGGKSTSTTAAAPSASVINTHLTDAGAGQRRAQAEALARIADDLGTPVILAGDLNAPIEAPELRPLAESFDDAFAAVGVSPGDPRRASCGSHRIDHLLTRGLHALECVVVRDAGDASDHLPIVATFSTGP